MRIIIFGTGKLYEKNRQYFRNAHIVVLLDNDRNKQGNWLDGYFVDCPENILHYQFDYVILASKYFESMQEQLSKIGVPDEKMLDLNTTDLLPKTSMELYCGKHGKKKILQDKKILLVTHYAELTGAPMVLLWLARILVTKGYAVDLYSPKRGSIISDFVSLGVSTVVFDTFRFTEENAEQYFAGYDLVIVNTVTLFNVIQCLKTLSIPVIWWLHEDIDVYKRYAIAQADLKVSDNIHIYGVSRRVIDAYKSYSHLDEGKIRRLTYGIPLSQHTISQFNGKRKLRFAIIGSVELRKGNDIFYHAVETHFDDWMPEAEFWMIGRCTIPDWERRSKCNEYFKIWGELSHEKLTELYHEIDVVVCPSRNDPMPVVLAEAMMNKKVCIMSDAVGTADLVTNYENGLICHVDDTDSLSECIEWVLKHRDKLEIIGENAFELYRREFSEEAFIQKVEEIIADSFKSTGKE